MTNGGSHQPASLDIPNPCVQRGCHDAQPIRTEGGAQNASILDYGFAKWLASFDIPNSGCFISRGGDYASSIGAKGGAPDDVRAASQTRAVWSADAVTMRRPFELKQALQTLSQ